MLLDWLDVLTIVGYFVVVVGAGFWYRRAASESLDAYFLGGRRLPWLALAMSGSVSNFDITGTMWIVSIIYLLGMKSMWHHWMWGFLMGAFFLAYMGKWVRRSNVMTAAEWMKTRFGSGPDGTFARLTYAFMAVLLQASFIGYAYQGIGKFAAVYIPLERLGQAATSPFLQNLFIAHEADVLATTIIGFTTLYVLVGGLYSVVVTDVIQTVVLTLGALFIAWQAWDKIGPEQLAALPDGFTSLRVPWRLPEFAGTEHAQFEFFGALVIVWVVKGLLLNAGGPGQMYDFQRFLAARNARDACKIGAAWSLFLVVRWGMAMGIALIALTGVAGVADPETVMPLVLRDFLPIGIRGLVLAGLLAAFMSTFSSTVNSGASFLVRDIWQVLIRRHPTDRQAMRASYIATIGIVLGGLLIGLQGESIHQIWEWMMMALGAGVIVPNVLRWYWWRLNGWGYGCGVWAGVILSIVQLIYPTLAIWIAFPIIVGASLLASLGVSWLTAPVSQTILVDFYEAVRPFGLWRPIRGQSAATSSPARWLGERPGLAIVNVVLGMMVIACAYLCPMYFVGHWNGHALICLAIVTAGAIVMKYTWYDHLPSEGE